MENKVYSVIIAVFVVNSIIISFCTSLYSDFMANTGNLTHIHKNNSVINITGY